MGNKEIKWLKAIQLKEKVFFHQKCLSEKSLLLGAFLVSQDLLMTFLATYYIMSGLPGGSDGKEFACNAGDIRDTGSIPGLGKSPGAGHGNPLQYSCLDNPMDRGAWRATVHGVAKSQTQLSD